MAEALAQGFQHESPGEVMGEIARVTPSYAGISFDRLENGGLQWPVPSQEHPGTPILHVGKFTRGMGLFSPVDYLPAAELPDADYPLVLTTGRRLYHYHTGTLTRRVNGLTAIVDREYVQINPADASRLGVAPGERVKVASRRGVAEGTAQVTAVVPEGVVSMDFHFSESPANALTNSAYDPVAKIAELKVCAVKVEKAAAGQTQ